jgi:hypothetical protein
MMLVLPLSGIRGADDPAPARTNEPQTVKNIKLILDEVGFAGSVGPGLANGLSTLAYVAAGLATWPCIATNEKRSATFRIFKFFLDFTVFPGLSCIPVEQTRCLY